MTDPRKLVAEQAEDEALWYDATSASEAYLQRELRKLHDAVERDPAMAVVDAAMAVTRNVFVVHRDEGFAEVTIDDARWMALLEACRKYAQEVEHE